MDILKKISALRDSRRWTEYRLAEESGLPQSTISSWYSKKMTPSLHSLEKICSAFGITMAQLFQEEADSVDLTAKQKELLEKWNRLNEGQQKAFLDFLDNC